MYSLKIYSITINTIILLAVVFTCMGSLRVVASSKVPIADTTREQVNDAQLVGLFEKLCRQISFTGRNYTVGGTISIDDKAEPAERMDHVVFLFCRQGDEFYYRLGKTVTVNAGGSYLYIDNGNKKIMLSQQKAVVDGTGLSQLTNMAANIKLENYRISSKIAGPDQTISLINERHVSCKEYAVKFDRRNMKIKSLYIRLTDQADPFNQNKEKIVKVSLSQWQPEANVNKYLTKDQVIVATKRGWKTVGEFSNYQLVNMSN